MPFMVLSIGSILGAPLLAAAVVLGLGATAEKAATWPIKRADTNVDKNFIFSFIYFERRPRMETWDNDQRGRLKQLLQVVEAYQKCGSRLLVSKPQRPTILPYFNAAIVPVLTFNFNFAYAWTSNAITVGFRTSLLDLSRVQDYLFGFGVCAKIKLNWMQQICHVRLALSKILNSILIMISERDLVLSFTLLALLTTRS